MREVTKRQGIFSTCNNYDDVKYASTDLCFHLAPISFLIALEVFSFWMLLGFDLVTWLMKFTLNLDLKSRFKSLTISLVTC